MKTLVRTWKNPDIFEEEYLAVLSKRDILIFHPRHIFKCKPRGLSFMDDQRYVRFVTPNTVPRNRFMPGVYAVSVEDFKEIMCRLPHFPNKKESKELRKTAIRKGH